MRLTTLFRMLLILTVAVTGIHVLGPGVRDDSAAAAAPSAPNHGGDDGGHGDDQFIKVEGIIDLPPAGPGGSPLSLPVTTPMTVGVTFGLPAIHIDVVINSGTAVPPPVPPAVSVTLHDGDRVRLQLRISNNSLLVTRLQILDFFELRLRGTVQDLTSPVHIPLGAGGSPVTFTLVIVQGPPTQSVPITLTPATRPKDDPFVLHNGDVIEVKAVVRDGAIRAVRIDREDEFEDDD